MKIKALNQICVHQILQNLLCFLKGKTPPQIKLQSAKAILFKTNFQYTYKKDGF